MRIAVDAMTICDKEGGVGAGIEHYTWSILFALVRRAPKHTFYLLVPSVFSLPSRNAFTLGIKNVRFLTASSRKLPFFTRHVWHAFRFLLCRPHVLFAPSGQYPIFWRGKTVATVHDILIYKHPDWFSEEQRTAFSTRIGVPLAIEHATQLVTVSRFTERELHALFPVTVHKTVTIYEGVDVPHEDELTTSHRFPFDRDYVVFVGTREPRKNLVRAFQAFDRFLQSHPEHARLSRFIVAGGRGFQGKEIDDEMHRVNAAWKHLEPHGVIQCLGKVTEEEKWNLLRRATCLFFPSLEEGFGLPILEAMAVGTPVITSTRGALEEVGGDVPIYVDPEHIEAMSFSIAQCLLVPEGVSLFKDEGIERAKLFHWNRSSKELLNVLESFSVPD